jgi:hypothetical protein
LLFGGFHGKRSLLFGRGAPRLLLGALCVVPFTSTSHRERGHHSKLHFSSGLAVPPSLSEQSSAEQRAAADHF